MKKTICLLLAVILFAYSLFSCNDANDTSSEEISAESSSASEDAVSDVSEEPSEESAEESSEESSEEIYVPTYETNVSLGKTYFGTSADNIYPDTYHAELTDGLYAGNDKGYSDPKWSNYPKPDPVTITIDLEDDCHSVYKFEVSFYSDIGPGITPPLDVCVYASDDCPEETHKWTFLCVVPTSLDIEAGSHISSITLDKPIDSRYIRFTMNHYAANLFLDEISIYADVEGVEAGKSLAKAVEEAYENDTVSYSTLLDGLETEEINYDYVLDAVSLRKAVKCSRNANAMFPTASKLTDCAPLGATYESGRWAGFDGSEPLDITVNLSKLRTDVCAFSLSAHNNPALGIMLPSYVDFYVSENNKEFTYIGRVYAPAEPDAEYYNYILALPKALHVRYAVFSIPEQERKMVFVEETGVFAYVEPTETAFTPLYSEEPIEEVTEEKLFDPSDEDYNENINLISGLSQRIFSHTPLKKGTDGNTSEKTKLLTDGKFAVNEYYTDSAFCHFGSGLGRDVVFDLGATATVTGFGVSFLREDDVGINTLSSVEFYLSENGVDWYPVYVGVTPSSKPTQIMRHTYELGKSYKARFARFSFAVWANAYCDELQVFGTKKVDGNSIPLSSSGIEAEKMDNGGFAERDKELLGGANDIVLVPNYCASDEKNGKKVGYTVDELIPYTAYVDKDGKIKDTMFDGFLFCPTGSMLEGHHAYSDANMREVKDMADKTFAAGRDIDALDKALEKTKSALSLDGYNVKYYLTLTYPGKGIDFGDLDGDGKSDRLENTADRINAVKWQIDYYLSLVSSAKYGSLTFAGFYWVHEAMMDYDEDGEMLNAVSDYCHSKGYDIFWIPYMSANGRQEWKYYGFDMACLQPNYAFNTAVSEQNIIDAVSLAKRYGMCIEMEVCGTSLTDPIFFDKYMDYLSDGVRYGYMSDTMHCYYQDVYYYLYACNSDDPKARLTYDYTYLFIKGKLELKAEKLGDKSFEAAKDTPFTADVRTEADYGECTVRVSPCHGALSMKPDGKFTYYPEKGYTGKDSFAFSYSNYLGESDLTEVVIDIR